MPPFARPDARGLQLRLKVQPRAKRESVGGLAPGVEGPRLRVAVNVAPEDGKANKAVTALLARHLHVPPAAVTLLHGATSREKTVLVEGDPASLTERLAALA
ncbi:DUF167 domain-containing protein [Acetobacteraceae bacterium H6797]|nr:DUF167 domain-containing protein [Acetobacteraceae bacterium H6797]